MATKNTTLLERLYGAGETRPFAGLTGSQASLRNSETFAARQHMARAGVKNTAFMSDQEVRDAYYSKPKTHWDAQEEHHTTGIEYRYYTMHPANAEGMINDLRQRGVKFQINSKTTLASTHGVKIGGSHNYDNDRHAVKEHPRLQIAVKAPAAFHDEMMEKHAQHLVYEGKTWDSFFKEALNSVTVAGVDGIPHTQPVKNEDDGVDNDDAAVYNGVLPDPTDTLNKIFDAETQARLAAVYGPNWHQLVSQSLASIPRLQPGNREAVNEQIEFIKESVANLTEELAAALNYVNSVGHGDTKPKFKSAMAWLEGIEHLYGKDVADKANDTLYSHGHKAALELVRGAAKTRHADTNTIEMNDVGRLTTGPYSQLHAAHLAEDFRPGLLNPGGLFGRQGDEVYTKHHGNFSTDADAIGPYSERHTYPEGLLYTDAPTKTLTNHLNGLKAEGKIKDFKWDTFVDEDSRTKSRLHITATHNQHKALDLNGALNAAREKRYAERDAFTAARRAADDTPDSPNNKPLFVTKQDRAVHAIVSKNPDASDEEIGKAWDEHVRAGTVNAETVPSLVRRYRTRVAYHQGKGNLPE